MIYDRIIKNNEGVERRYNFDYYWRTIYLKTIYKNGGEIESWYKWEGRTQVEITQQEFKQIERIKL